MSSCKKSQQLIELETLTVLAAFLLILNLFFHRQEFVCGAIMLILTGLFIKPVARVITNTWLRFSGILGVINSKIILSIVFFLFLTPLAFLFRLFTKNPLNLKKTNDISLYHERNHSYSKVDFEKMW